MNSHYSSRLTSLLAGLSFAVGIAVLPFANAGAGGGAEEEVATDKPYTVDCEQKDENGQAVCLTDKDTYVGWRTYHATCHVCHGQDAVGSSFAPSLVERLKVIDKARFEDVVKNGMKGQMGVMPGWGENPNVKGFIDELYVYLQARSDGALKPGRPQWKK